MAVCGRFAIGRLRAVYGQFAVDGLRADCWRVCGQFVVCGRFADGLRAVLLADCGRFCGRFFERFTVGCLPAVYGRYAGGFRAIGAWGFAVYDWWLGLI